MRRKLVFVWALWMATAFAACGSSDGSSVGDGLLLSVSLDGSGSGVVTSSPPGIDCGADCMESYPENGTVTLTATPSAGAEFLAWSDPQCPGTGTCTLTISAAKSIVATFQSAGGGGGGAGDGLTGPGVTVTVVGSGSVTSTPSAVTCGPGMTTCDAKLAVGTTVTLTAAAASGQRFAGWSGACAGTASCNVVVSALHPVGATFVPLAAGRFLARPYLFKADEVRLRASVAARDPEATGTSHNEVGVPIGFLSVAQEALADRSSYSDISTWNLAVAGWLQNNTAMLQRAHDEAMAIVAAAPSGDSGTGDNFQHVEERMFNVAATADLAYAQFSVMQLSQVATWVNGTLTNWNNQNIGFWPHDEPRNNYWQNGFLAHAIGGIATEGFNAQASAWRTKAEQMAAKYTAATKPPNWSGPMQTEGHYYSGYVSNALWAMELYDAAMGTGFVASSSFSFANQLDLAMFQTRPHLTQFFMVGSEPSNSVAPHTNVSLAYWHHLAHSGRYTPQAQQAKSVLATAETDNVNFWSRADKGFVSFYWNLRRISGVPLATKTDRLLVSPAQGAGLIALRSSAGFQANARAALMFANQFNFDPAFSHSNPDSPGFQWGSGSDWLVTDPDYYGRSGILAEAGSDYLSDLSNIVTLSSQKYNDSGGQPIVNFALDNSTQAVPHYYMQINAQPYWNTASTYRRDYVWLDDLQVVAIFDRIVGAPAKKWRLHVPSQPTIVGKTASYVIGGKTVAIRDLLATGNGIWVTENLRPAVTDSDVWRLSQDDSSNDYRSLKVLDVGGRISAASVVAAAGSYQAVLTINGVTRRITFFDNGTQTTVQ